MLEELILCKRVFGGGGGGGEGCEKKCFIVSSCPGPGPRKLRAQSNPIPLKLNLT